MSSPKGYGWLPGRLEVARLDSSDEMPDAVEAEMADHGGGCGLRRLDVDGFLFRLDPSHRLARRHRVDLLHCCTTTATIKQVSSSLNEGVGVA